MNTSIEMIRNARAVQVAQGWDGQRSAKELLDCAQNILVLVLERDRMSADDVRDVLGESNDWHFRQAAQTVLTHWGQPRLALAAAGAYLVAAMQEMEVAESRERAA